MVWPTFDNLPAIGPVYGGISCEPEVLSTFLLFSVCDGCESNFLEAISIVSSSEDSFNFDAQDLVGSSLTSLWTESPTILVSVGRGSTFLVGNLDSSASSILMLLKLSGGFFVFVLN